MRVQIPTYTDRWMMGDRYGEVLTIVRRHTVKAEPDSDIVDIATVWLDKSGKTVRVILDDCTVVS